MRQVYEATESEQMYKTDGKLETVDYEILSIS